MEWQFSDGTSLTGVVTPKSGGEYDADDSQDPVDYDVDYIVTTNVLSVRDFMTNPNVLPFVRLTAVFQMKKM